WEVTMTEADETAAPAEGADAAEDAAAEAGLETPEETSELGAARAAHTLSQQLEALLIVADEPLSAVSLATATDRPVREVRAGLEALVADYNGDAGGPMRGFELREVAGGYRFYVRES